MNKRTSGFSSTDRDTFDCGKRKRDEGPRCGCQVSENAGAFDHDHLLGVDGGDSHEADGEGEDEFLHIEVLSVEVETLSSVFLLHSSHISLNIDEQQHKLHEKYDELLRKKVEKSSLGLEKLVKACIFSINVNLFAKRLLGKGVFVNGQKKKEYHLSTSP